MFYFFKRGTDSVQCEVRAAQEGPGYRIVITTQDGNERLEHFESSAQVHARWLQLHDTFQRDGWWGPSTQDGR